MAHFLLGATTVLAVEFLAILIICLGGTQK